MIFSYTGYKDAQLAKMAKGNTREWPLEISLGWLRKEEWKRGVFGKLVFGDGKQIFWFQSVCIKLSFITLSSQYLNECIYLFEFWATTSGALESKGLLLAEFGVLCVWVLATCKTSVLSIVLSLWYIKNNKKNCKLTVFSFCLLDSVKPQHFLLIPQLLLSQEQMW